MEAAHRRFESVGRRQLLGRSCRQGQGAVKARLRRRSLAGETGHEGLQGPVHGAQALLCLGLSASLERLQFGEALLQRVEIARIRQAGPDVLQHGPGRALRDSSGLVLEVPQLGFRGCFVERFAGEAFRQRRDPLLKAVELGGDRSPFQLLVDGAQHRLHAGDVDPLTDLPQFLLDPVKALHQGFLEWELPMSDCLHL